MEMFGEIYPQLNGMPGTPRVDSCREQLTGYIYRAIVVSALVARKLEFDAVEGRVRELLVKFETELNCKPEMTAEEMLKEMKQKTT